MNSLTRHSDNQYPTNILRLAQRLWSQRNLIARLVRQDISVRYKGSLLGVSWSLINPLLMLAIYTVIFSYVFQARWGLDVNQTSMDFALVLFFGLILHGLLTECINRAPVIVVQHPSYVKRVLFPLEILPVVLVLSALFHSLVSFTILVGFLLAAGYMPNLQWLLLPVVLLPLIGITLGLSWILGAMGVFLRDISQLTGSAGAVLLFVSPIFYPLSSLPDALQWAALLNPLTLPIEQSRAVIFGGANLDYPALMIYYLIAIAFTWSGLAVFQRTRHGFADVI
jgi:lipopolysaccharide transport system permease protein